MRAISLRQKWADLGIIFLLSPCGKDVTIEAPHHVLTPECIEEIRQHKLKIICWLQSEQRNKGQKEEAVPFASVKPDTTHQIKQSFLQELSYEEITRYRLLLEASYLNPANDAFHGDGMPQRFRDGTHTFAEMQTALENFIGKLQQGNSPVLEKGSRLPSELPLLTGNLDKHSLAVTGFIKARDSLPEYQAWEKMCKLLTENPHDAQVKKACSLASEAFLNACKALPEWLPFWEAKIDQYLAKSLEGYSLSL